MCLPLYSACAFKSSIEEILISPMHDSLLLLGYVLGGMLRGIIVALFVFIVACFFMEMHVHNIALAFLVVLLVSAIFSMAGFANAMVARNFDDVMIIPTFVLAPLTYLGGVFYSTTMLPPFWQNNFPLKSDTLYGQCFASCDDWSTRS